MPDWTWTYDWRVADCPHSVPDAQCFWGLGIPHHIHFETGRCCNCGLRPPNEGKTMSTVYDTPLEPDDLGFASQLPEHWRSHERYEQDSETRLWSAEATDNTDSGVRIYGARTLRQARMALIGAVGLGLMAADREETS